MPVQVENNAESDHPPLGVDRWRCLKDLSASAGQALMGSVDYCPMGITIC